MKMPHSFFAQILDAFSGSREETDEVISSEEMLSHIDYPVEEIPEGLCVGSLDVQSLYPSLDVPQCAETVKTKIMDCPLTFEGVNYKKNSLFSLYYDTNRNQQRRPKWHSSH